MKRVSLSSQEKTITSVWEWYEAVRSISLRDKGRIRASIQVQPGDAAGVPEAFVGMTLPDIDEWYSDKLRELDWVTCLELLAATEAALTVDFHIRVRNRLKGEPSEKFRLIHKERPDRIRLIEDILDPWADARPDNKKQIGNFKGTLKLRHWLAHGRYWTPKLGRRYDALDVYRIVEAILKSFDLI